MKITVAIPIRKFELGRIVSTPGALDACSPERLAECLARHASADWGCVGKDDAAENELSLKAQSPHRPKNGQPHLVAQTFV